MNNITTTKIYKKDTDIVKYLRDEIYKKYNIKLANQDILSILLNKGKTKLKNELIVGLKSKIN